MSWIILPSLDNLAKEQIDVKKLLELRNSPDAIDLRRWIRQSFGEPDKEIEDQFRSIKEKLASISQSKTARAVRFFAVTGAGLTPGIGLPLGIAATAADRYMADTITGKPGPISFLSKNYKSIFDF